MYHRDLSLRLALGAPFKKLLGAAYCHACVQRCYTHYQRKDIKADGRAWLSQPRMAATIYVKPSYNQPFEARPIKKTELWIYNKLKMKVVWLLTKAANIQWGLFNRCKRVILSEEGRKRLTRRAESASLPHPEAPHESLALPEMGNVWAVFQCQHTLCSVR